MFPLGDVERSNIVPVGTYGLIALNVLMFLVQTMQGDVFTTSYAATPYEITHNFDITHEFEMARPPHPFLPNFLVSQEPDSEDLVAQGVWRTWPTSVARRPGF